MISIVEALTGGPIRGSWWSHNRAHEIFDVSTYLSEHDQVLTLKLVEKRVTFVHARLWPAVLGVVGNPSWRRRAREDLSRGASRLLQRVQRSTGVRTDLLGAQAMKAGKELETSLLVHAEQIHTDDGHHATVLQSWGRWASPREVEALYLSDARTQLREACGPHIPV